MKLAAWRKEKGWTQDDLAKELGSTQGYISRIERSAITKDFRMPGTRMLLDLYLLTDGAVTPNDFYDLPDLIPQRKAA